MLRFQSEFSSSQGPFSSCSWSFSVIMCSSIVVQIQIFKHFKYQTFNTPGWKLKYSQREKQQQQQLSGVCRLKELCGTSCAGSQSWRHFLHFTLATVANC